jgi:hypothetical protein
MGHRPGQVPAAASIVPDAASARAIGKRAFSGRILRGLNRCNAWNQSGQNQQPYKMASDRNKRHQGRTQRLGPDQAGHLAVARLLVSLQAFARN